MSPLEQAFDRLDRAVAHRIRDSRLPAESVAAACRVLRRAAVLEMAVEQGRRTEAQAILWLESMTERMERR